MIRRPVVIGSAMLLSAAAWSVGPWRVSALIIFLYTHYIDIRISFSRLLSSKLMHCSDDENFKEPSSVQGAPASH